MHTRRAVKTCFTLTSMFYNYAADIPKIRLLTIVGVTSYMGHWSKCPPPMEFTHSHQFCKFQFYSLLNLFLLDFVNMQAVQLLAQTPGDATDKHVNSRREGRPILGGLQNLWFRPCTAVRSMCHQTPVRHTLRSKRPTAVSVRAVSY